jgi:hypothetical protein|nr:MAG TPA: hypothetical protein [Caudoviricetes sp.]
MGIIGALADKVRIINEQLTNGAYVAQIILDNEAFIIDANAQEQLYDSGENALGVSIADYRPYSPVTIQIKELKGQPTDRVTLRDEGEFQSSFFVEVGNESFTIKASDFKAEELVQKYGTEIMGLNDEHKAELIHEYIYPAIMEKIKQTLNK